MMASKSCACLTFNSCVRPSRLMSALSYLTDGESEPLSPLSTVVWYSKVPTLSEFIVRIGSLKSEEERGLRETIRRERWRKELEKTREAKQSTGLQHVLLNASSCKRVWHVVGISFFFG